MFKKLAVIAVIALALFFARASFAGDVFSTEDSDYSITFRVWDSGMYQARYNGYIKAGVDLSDLDTFSDIDPYVQEEIEDDVIAAMGLSGFMGVIVGWDCQVLEDSDMADRRPFQCKGEKIFKVGATYETIIEDYSEDPALAFLAAFLTASGTIEDQTGPLDSQQLVLNGKAYDSDKDGIHDDFDACPDAWDSELDSDGDGIDDACDDCLFDPHNTCPAYGSGSSSGGDDDGDGEDDGEDDTAPGLGDWLSGTEGPSSSSNVSEGGGCNLMTGQPAGFTAYIMIALALIPVAIRRRK